MHEGLSSTQKKTLHDGQMAIIKTLEYPFFEKNWQQKKTARAYKTGHVDTAIVSTQDCAYANRSNPCDWNSVIACCDASCRFAF